MRYHAADYLLLLLYIAVRVYLLAILWRRRLIRSWPALAALSATEISSAVVLRSVAQSYSVYFYSYWCFSALGALLSFAALRDVICAIPGTRQASKPIATFFLLVAGTVTFVFVIVRYEMFRAQSSVLSSVLALNDAVQTAWYILFLAILGAVALFGFGWPKLPLEVTSGFVCYGIASAIFAHILARWPRYGATVDHVYSVVYLAVFMYWCLCFRQKPQRSEATQ